VQPVGGADGRPAGRGELTPTERRIAELVAVGRRNAEVAAELGLGVKTLETHLSRIFRKLGVRSRTELAARAEGVSLRPDGSLRDLPLATTTDEQGQLRGGAR
jgi:DNA-binding CsgD family transcriptional regulator